MFSKETVGKACEILTPALVAQVFGVAETSLKQYKPSGCAYSAEADGKNLSVMLAMLNVHDTVPMAETWFQNATRSMSKDEAVRLMQGVTEGAKKREEIDTDTKKKAVGDMGDLVAGSVSEDGVQYEPVASVGDEARVNNSDGGLWVRKGNLTFLVAAYYGPDMPPPNMAGVAIKDMAKAAMKANTEWKKKTVPQRRADATRVAEAVVEALP
jgi:hypothetical protein